MAAVLVTGSIDIEAIKDQHPLASIVEQHVALKRRSGNLVGLCPFHPERTPSFNIFEKDQRYHCFGCGAHGDVFDFLRDLKGLDLRAAAEQITGKVHLPTYTPERIEELRLKHARFEEEHRQRRQAAIAQATERWMAANPNFLDHPYLETKGIQPHGTRREGDLLLVPLIGEDAKIQTLQSISPDGRKLFISDAPVSGGFFVVGGKVARTEDPVILCEGFATAASIHEATGWVTVCAFNAGNLAKVADILKRVYPDKTYRVAGDDDRGKERNVGREAAIAAAAILGGPSIFPAFPEGAEGTDFNDMAQAYDNEAVRSLIVDGVMPSGEVQEPDYGDIYPVLSLDDLENLPPPTYLIDDMLPEHGLTVVYGDPGAGKSFIVLDMALRIAFGMDWHGTPAKQVGVLYIAGEGRHGLGKRVKGWRKEHGLEGADAPFKLLPVAVHMLDPESVEKLKRTIVAVSAQLGFSVGLVVVDTVSRAIAGADENKQDSMSLFVDGCGDIQACTNGALIGVHHSGKDKEKGMRGSSVLLGACDATMRITKDERVVTIKTEKQKDDEEADPVHMTMKKVEWNEGLVKPLSTLVPVKGEVAKAEERQLTKAEANEIFSVIQQGWTDKAPWSSGPHAKRRGRYLPDMISERYSISHNAALGYVMGWQQRDYLKNDICDPRNKVSGLKVVKFLEPDQ